jgi:hypothetical protein
MTDVSPATAVRTSPIHVPVWAWSLAAFATLVLYLISQENGALLGAGAAEFLHEVTHDARHALGVPCH